MKYDLIVVWANGDKETYRYDTQELARRAAQNMYTAFGRQIAWTYIQEAR